MKNALRTMLMLSLMGLGTACGGEEAAEEPVTEEPTEEPTEAVEEPAEEPVEEPVAEVEPGDRKSVV